MKDGRIAAQGTLDDVIAADPDMYSEYNKAIELASESEAELEQSGYESESVKEERLRLKQQVKTAILTKQISKGINSEHKSLKILQNASTPVTVHVSSIFIN